MLSNSLICSQPHLRQRLGGPGRIPSQRTALSLAGDFATSQHLITPSTLEFETFGLFKQLLALDYLGIILIAELAQLVMRGSQALGPKNTV